VAQGRARRSVGRRAGPRRAGDLCGHVRFGHLAQYGLRGSVALGRVALSVLAVAAAFGSPPARLSRAARVAVVSAQRLGLERGELEARGHGAALTLPVELVEALVAELADALAPRIAAEFAAVGAASGPGESGWRLLTLEQAAQALTRSTRWVRERVKRGDLAHVRLDGGALAFRVEDLEAFADARRVPLEEPGPLAGPLARRRNPASAAGSRGREPVLNRRVEG
jgi:hypothetical protein